jgi:hypothetical protein
MIAITVSTNYSDLVPFVLEANERFFKHWYWITDINDNLTIEAIPKTDKHTVLYYDFQNNGRTFDKGGALKLAQGKAYGKFPEDWYLILDSDIALYPNFNINTDELDPTKLYGIPSRLAFYSRESFDADIPDERIWTGLAGFFQLYKEKIFYPDSNDAGGVDNLFTDNWLKNAKTEILKNITCRHLGSTNHWYGRVLGSDFRC